jgi:hypothetical protein
LTSWDIYAVSDRDPIAVAIRAAVGRPFVDGEIRLTHLSVHERVFEEVVCLRAFWPREEFEAFALARLQALIEQQGGVLIPYHRFSSPGRGVFTTDAVGVVGDHHIVIQIKATPHGAGISSAVEQLKRLIEAYRSADSGQGSRTTASGLLIVPAGARLPGEMPRDVRVVEFELASGRFLEEDALRDVVSTDSVSADGQISSMSVGRNQ